MHADQSVAPIAGLGHRLLRWHLGRAGRKESDGAAVSLLGPAGRDRHGRGRALRQWGTCIRMRCAQGQARVGLLLDGQC